MNNRVLPTSIMLDEATRKVDEDAMIRTTKAAVLNTDENFPNVIALLVCDQKSVCFYQLSWIRSVGKLALKKL